MIVIHRALEEQVPANKYNHAWHLHWYSIVKLDFGFKDFMSKEKTRLQVKANTPVLNVILYNFAWTGQK